MSWQSKLFVLFAGIFLILLVLELVRRRKIREEYSVLWILTAITMFALAWWEGLLLFFTHLIGAVMNSSTIFFFGITFLGAICLHFSIKISQLTNQVKELAQEVAILRAEIEESGGKPPIAGEQK
ncbi:MAG: DUF2304 domain-containing protein [Chloroflexi bacterium]|nr:DUF2304 domain-containing protein [Chloroflexota bacterium]